MEAGRGPGSRMIAPDVWVVHDVGVGGGRAADRWRDVERALVAQNITFELATVRDQATTDSSVGAALEAGTPLIVVVGGDPTLGAVVDALMRLVPGDPADRPALGMIPAGSGADLPRTFGLPDDVERASKRLLSPNHYEMDVMRLAVARPGGGERTLHAANVVQIGLAADVTRSMLAKPTSLGRVRRFVAFWSTLPGAKHTRVEVTAGSRSFRGSARDVVIGNCQFASEGLRVSPRSFPGDGLLDVVIHSGPKSEAYRLMPKMWKGEHIPGPGVNELRGREISVSAEKPMTVEADGAIVGTTPLRCELIPKAIRLRV